MSLQKGFLRKSESFKPHPIGLGVILAFNTALVLYGLFFFIRESFRLQTGLYVDSILLEFTAREQFVYDWFYAVIACVLGLHAGMTFYLRNSIPFRDVPVKRAKRHMLAYSGFINWTFLMVAGKLFVLFGICHLAFGFQFDISLIDEFPLLLILIPFVLFLQHWPVVLKAFGRRGLNVMWASGAIITVFSLLMTRIDFYDVESFNRQVRNINPLVAYDIKLPSTSYHSHFQYHNQAMELYIATSDTDGPPGLYWPSDLAYRAKGIVLDGRHEDLKTLADLNKKLLIDNAKDLGQYRASRRVIIFSDYTVPLGYIRKLYKVLRSHGVDGVYFSTGVRHSKYPAYYPSFRRLGIFRFVGFSFPEKEAELIKFLDSLELLDPKKYQLKLSPSLLLRVGLEKGLNRVSVRLTNEDIFLNGQQVSEGFLRDFTRKFIQKYPQSNLMMFYADDNVTLGEYLNCLDQMLIAEDQIEREAYYKWKGTPFDDMYHSQAERDSINSEYKLGLIEWTREEQRLVEWLQRSKEID